MDAKLRHSVKPLAQARAPSFLDLPMEIQLMVLRKAVLDSDPVNVFTTDGTGVRSTLRVRITSSSDRSTLMLSLACVNKHFAGLVIILVDAVVRSNVVFVNKGDAIFRLLFARATRVMLEYHGIRRQYRLRNLGLSVLLKKVPKCRWSDEKKQPLIEMLQSGQKQLQMIKDFREQKWNACFENGYLLQPLALFLDRR